MPMQTTIEKLEVLRDLGCPTCSLRIARVLHWGKSARNLAHWKFISGIWSTCPKKLISSLTFVHWCWLSFNTYPLSLFWRIAVFIAQRSQNIHYKNASWWWNAWFLSSCTLCTSRVCAKSKRESFLVPIHRFAVDFGIVAEHLCTRPFFLPKIIVIMIIKIIIMSCYRHAVLGYHCRGKSQVTAKLGKILVMIGNSVGYA